MEPHHTTEILRRVLQARDDFPVLTRSDGPGALTVLPIVDVQDPDDYERRARSWAGAVWTAWTPHHALITSAVTAALD